MPARLVPVERRAGEDVEARILRYAAALAEGLRAAGPADVHHAEDCLSARSLLALRAEGRFTVPTTIGDELRTNPFLRAEDPLLQRAIGMEGADPVEVFAETRRRKDRF